MIGKKIYLLFKLFLHDKCLACNYKTIINNNVVAKKFGNKIIIDSGVICEIAIFLFMDRIALCI